MALSALYGTTLGRRVAYRRDGRAGQWRSATDVELAPDENCVIASTSRFSAGRRPSPGAPTSRYALCTPLARERSLAQPPSPADEYSRSAGPPVLSLIRSAAVYRTPITDQGDRISCLEQGSHSGRRAFAVRENASPTRRSSRG